jgi:hypothetical protein
MQQYIPDSRPGPTREGRDMSVVETSPTVPSPPRRTHMRDTRLRIPHMRRRVKIAHAIRYRSRIRVRRDRRLGEGDGQQREQGGGSREVWQTTRKRHTPTRAHASSTGASSSAGAAALFFAFSFSRFFLFFAAFLPGAAVTTSTFAALSFTSADLFGVGA